MQNIVSTHWLHENISDPSLIVLFTTIKEIPIELSGIRIPGARFMDLKTVFRNTKAVLPNTFPEVGALLTSLRELGINNDSKVVVYDPAGNYSSPRAWFLLKTAGIAEAGVLDGGMREWINQGYETEVMLGSEYERGDFRGEFSDGSIISLEGIERNIENEECLVIDARSSGRFEGTAPEPRAGLRSGHIPQSINLPFTEVLNDGLFKSPKEMERIATQLRLGNKKLIFSCGSGITACIIMLALSQVVSNELALFDGSWTEWATVHTEAE